MNRSIFLHGISTIVFVVLLNACAAPGPTASSEPTASPVLAPEPAPIPAAVPASVPKSNESYTGTASVDPGVAAEPAKPVVIAPDQLLQEGNALYDKGDYRGAIRKLTAARDAAEEGSVVKKASLRLLAFSYCVSSQRVLCRQQFSALLGIDPNFQLTRGEAGHPLWGPVFLEAKNAQAAPRKK